VTDDSLKAAIDRAFAKAYADLPQPVATPPLATITVHKYAAYL
jgi:hypothetical protein